MNQMATPILRGCLAQLLLRLLSRRIRSHIHMSQSPCPVLDDHKHVQHAEGRGHRDEEVAGDDGLGVVLQERRPASVASRMPGACFGMYFLTVRAETRMSSLRSSSFAIRSSPHRGFSMAIR
jgi:hypothetical protein